MILSAQFWPAFKEEIKLELPDVAKEQFDIYTKAFETLKVGFSYTFAERCFTLIKRCYRAKTLFCHG